MMQRFVQLSDFKLVVGSMALRTFLLFGNYVLLVSEALNGGVFHAPLQAIGFI